MKKDELQKCICCNKGVMHTRIPLFHRVRIERMAVNMRAVQAQAGLEMMLGSAALASVMGPNEDIAETFDGPYDVLICENCSMEPTLIPAIVEKIVDKQEGDDVNGK